MHLLVTRWTRNALGLLAAGLLLAAAVAPCHPLAQDEQDPPAGGDSQVEDQAEATPPAQPVEDEAAQDEAEQPQPRRLPPRTDAEERSYKLAKAQNDPFLLDQLNGEVREGPGEFYDPLEWVLPLTTGDLSRYIVQDASGAVLGHVEIGIELAQGGSGLFQLDIMNELRPATSITVIGRAENLDVLTSERTLLLYGRQPAGPPAPGSEPAVNRLMQQPRTTVQYNYDRIKVQLDRGGVVTHARLRELPYSFDRDVLPLLLRQIDYQNIAWPFEAVATDTLQLKSLPLALDKPERVSVMSAEPASYYCFESGLRVGADTSTWWVEQVPPHRLVKFAMDGLTYTLERYVAQ